MRAVRNINLCTKDCLCLYVCPTGATDTETGQIDQDKCLDGCRLCVDACCSGAISLVPVNYPPQQDKNPETRKALYSLASSKLKQEQVAKGLIEKSSNPDEQKFLKGIAKSNRLMAEDLLREAGFLLPQSTEVKKLLKSILANQTQEDFPVKAVESLLKQL